MDLDDCLQADEIFKKREENDRRRKRGGIYICVGGGEAPLQDDILHFVATKYTLENMT